MPIALCIYDEEPPEHLTVPRHGWLLCVRQYNQSASAWFSRTCPNGLFFKIPQIFPAEAFQPASDDFKRLQNVNAAWHHF